MKSYLGRHFFLSRNLSEASTKRLKQNKQPTKAFFFQHPKIYLLTIKYASFSKPKILKQLRSQIEKFALFDIYN